MKLKSNLHTHTSFSDGINTMEEMVTAAISKGFVSLGISDHGPEPYDKALRHEDIPAYKQEFYRLKEKYADEIELYLGIEHDWLSDWEAQGLDYTIGSVHYLRDEESGGHFCIDYKPEMFAEGVEKLAHGDVRQFIALYFDTLCQMAQTRKPDIIGHMNIIVKLNGGGRFFDEGSDWYRDICADTAARIADVGCLAEINTALARQPGREFFYPSPFILERLWKEGGGVVISSDCHSADSLDFRFDEAAEMLKRCGFKAVKQLQNGKFTDIEI
ncbi:MAG: histidinol-phosphatase [Oscillospiraceae bacterium]|nr:histidinol-phosphatase [Oscillospiraceae bacterium]